ncbi:MAG: cellulase family glycosylhydrolase [Bacteroidaceae bacterium]|nr:cellulase family glycosylhydrolase [Bacteroidaceae bacterium]
MKKFLLLTVAACSLSLSLMGQVVAHGKLQPLHVDGKYLKDPYGNKVVLHGVMDTPSPYFNNNRWGNSATDGNVSACVNYFNKLFVALTDSTSGAYCNLFRLHLDPCWTNNNSASWTQDDRESGTGEANISHYDPSRLRKYMKTLYWRITNQAMKHGLYVIMRPPGVCPATIYVGGSYQQYLLNVWDIVTQNDSVLKYYGQVGIELANEPVSVKNADGSESDRTLHDFFQPIVDKIRANGFKGIIWVPGSGWQMNYRPYAKYPITGDQIGYAVHDYVGWYDTNDDHYDHDNAIKKFGESIPIVRTNPIAITEVDWSPYKEGTGHYNEHGDWVLSNYGTWATGTTSKWGLAYKAVLDYYGNISMTLSGTHTFLDIDTYLKTKKVVPAFKTAMEANGLDPYEASGVACFQWYADYAKVDYPSVWRYQPLQEVPENPFAVTKDWFIPTILYEGSATYGASMNTLKLKQGGCSGWRFENEEGIDISDCNYLVIRLARNATKNTRFLFYDTANYWAEPSATDIGVKKDIKIDLHDLKTASGRAIDLTHIRMAGFSSLGADQTLYVKEIFLSNDGVNPVSRKVSLEDITTLIDQYLAEGSNVTLQDITALIDKYLEQED